jgi:dihydrolipoamide dehydrogenase
MSLAYDVVVIGSGPGGYVAAARAGALGLKVAVVEKAPALGGTCLHWGCIPTKALLHAADLVGEFKEAARMGVVSDGVRVEWDKVQKHKNQVVKSNAGGVAHLMKSRNVEVHTGFGRLLSPKRVEIEASDGTKKTLEAKHVLIAVGSRPHPLPFAPFDGERILSSDHILGLDRIPGTLTVVGGGIIGIEFASLFARLGTKVTVLEALPRIVATADEEVSALLTKELKRQGIEVKTGVMVKSIENQGTHALTTVEDGEGKSIAFDAEYTLVSIGRAPMTEGIGLENTRVQKERGHLVVNGMMETDEPGVYAIGDCVPTPGLAHVASAEGLIAVEHMAGQAPAALNYVHTPSCVYCEPNVAWSGLTEAEAKAEGYAVKVGKFNFAANAKAAIIGKKRGFVKFVTDAKYGEILGVHIIGPQATDLLAEPAYAMQMETTINDIATTVHAHPTLYEAIYEAAGIAAGRAVHG